MNYRIRNFLFTLLSVVSLQAADDPQTAAVTAAGDARTTAMKSADRAGLVAVFSDDLRYSHSTGQVDTKASFIDALTSGKTKYLSMEYEKREFSFPAPSIALMTGRTHIKAATAEKNFDDVLNFLAVWRLENGHWRFLAWQSCKLVPAAKP
ncbi:MAG: nuclear transport factor 2 family protein [Chthoniobacteraceae bacterium]